MRVSLTPEQRALQQSLRRQFADTCATSTGRIDRGADVSSRVLQVLSESGMLGLPYREEFGGAGAGLFETGLLYFEGGRALCPSLVYTTMMSGIAIELLGDPSRVGAWVRSFATGATTAATALWSPENARAIRPVIRADRDGGRLALHGTAMFVENAAVAGKLLVIAHDRAADQYLLAVAAATGPAVHHRHVTMFGRDPVAHVTLDGQPAEQVAVVSRDGVVRLAEIAVALQCMEMVGGTERVIEETVRYVAQREQFGRPIGSFQAVQHVVADLRIALDAARLAASHALWHVGLGRPGARLVAIAKLLCSEAYKTATLQCHQLMGGMGFLRESDLHLWSERAKVSEIRNGSPEVALGWLAAELADR